MIVNFVNLKIARLAAANWKAANLNSTDLNLARACICADGGVDTCICASADACARADTGSAANTGSVVGSVALSDADATVIAAVGNAKELLFCEPSLNLRRVKILKQKFRPKKASAKINFKPCFKISKPKFCFKLRFATDREASPHAVRTHRARGKIPRAAQGFKTASRKIPRGDLLRAAPQAKFKKLLKFSLEKPRLKLLFPI